MSYSTFKVIVPSDVELIETNVAADTNPEWSSTTNYPVNYTVKVTTETPHKIYKSLRGNNYGRVPSENLEPSTETTVSTTSMEVATGDIIITAESGKSFLAGMEVTIAKTSRPKTINMSAEVVNYNSETGGLGISRYAKTGEGTHSDWTITAADEIGFWEETGATNQYAMIDEYLNTKTSNLGTIEAKFSVTNVDYISLIGLEGMSVELELWNDAETVQYWSETKSLIYSSSSVTNISNWYDYFFGAQSPIETIVCNVGIVISSGVLVVKIIAADGEYAKCGNLVVGRSYDIGKTMYGASAGMVDYSDIEEDDDTGATSITEGPWAKYNEINTYIYNDDFDSVYKTVVDLRATPALWVVGDSFKETFAVYGLCRDFEIIYSTNVISYCSFEIKGVI